MLQITLRWPIESGWPTTNRRDRAGWMVTLRVVHAVSCDKRSETLTVSGWLEHSAGFFSPAALVHESMRRYGNEANSSLVQAR